MQVTLKILSPLQPFFNNVNSLEIDVSDYWDIYSALVNMFPAFKNLLNSMENKNHKFQDVVFVEKSNIIDVSKFKIPFRKPSEVYLAPVLFGAYDFKDLYTDVKKSFLFPLLGLSTAGSESMDMEGLDKRIIESSIFRNQDRLYATGIRRQNDIFEGLKVNVNAGLPIALIYGMHQVSGTAINTYIKNYRCDPDIFRVQDVVNVN